MIQHPDEDDEKDQTGDERSERGQQEFRAAQGSSDRISKTAERNGEKPRQQEREQTDAESDRASKPAEKGHAEDGNEAEKDQHTGSLLSSLGVTSVGLDGEVRPDDLSTKRENFPLTRRAQDHSGKFF